MRGIVELLGKGHSAAEEIGAALLNGRALAIWRKALLAGPSGSLDTTLESLKQDDGLEACVSVAWMPASALAASPRRFVRLVGLNSSRWPRGISEDRLISDHVIPTAELDPLPVAAADRRDFETILATTERQVVLSRARRDREGKKLVINKFQMRGRFAMRLADYKDEEGGAARLGSVRESFNSPFRPFALATTSVGQEGLDFHPYCYRVYHWNLPGNPVDLEQREGRVHRFKGHAVRLNLAHRHGRLLQRLDAIPDDPWQAMFDAARAETEIDSDLIPYWIYEGPVKVERRVPSLPFSREVRRLEWLKRSLTVYRLAFGQPRQEDLLEYLHSLIGTETAAEDLAELQIRLQP